MRYSLSAAQIQFNGAFEMPNAYIRTKPTGLMIILYVINMS